MLTDLQYAAVGKLTLSFNHIEWTFAELIAHLGGTENRGLRGSFSKKAGRLRSLLGNIEKGNPAINLAVHDLQIHIQKAEDVARLRNEYVHALVVHDFATNITKVRIKDDERILWPRELTLLAVESIMLAENIQRFGNELLSLL
jgi:hypothetical protein